MESLKTYLDRKKISDKDFAIAIGVAVSSVSRLKRGLQKPSLPLLHKITVLTGNEVGLESFFEPVADEARQ